MLSSFLDQGVCSRTRRGNILCFLGTGSSVGLMLRISIALTTQRIGRSVDELSAIRNLQIPNFCFSRHSFSSDIGLRVPVVQSAQLGANRAAL
jgi:hypothetical protein